jgi:hypothetical protein
MLKRIYYQELDDHDSAPDFEQATLSNYEALVDGENEISEWQIAELFEKELDDFEFNEDSEAYIAIWLDADTFVGTYRVHCCLVKSFHSDLQG